MADLGDLGEFIANSLDFDLDGRHYSVPPVEWPVYLELMQVQEHLVAVAQGKATAEDGPEDKPIHETSPVVLGPVFQQLVDNGVSGPRITHLGRAAYLFQIGRIDAAMVLLGASGKAPTPAPESGSTSTTPTGSTGSASGTGTKRPASSTGTRSRTTSKPRSRSTSGGPAAKS